MSDSMAALVVALASLCAPEAPINPLLELVDAQSGFDPWAVRVDGTAIEDIATVEQAIATAMAGYASGRVVEVGLGGLRARDLTSFGVTVADGLDPCVNLAVLYQRGFVGDVESGLSFGSEARPWAMTAQNVGYGNSAAELAFEQFDAADPWAGGIPSLPVDGGARGAGEETAQNLPAENHWVIRPQQ